MHIVQAMIVSSFAFLLIVVVDILTFLVLIVFKFMDSTAMHCH